MAKSFIESIIPFITNMRKGVGEDVPTPVGGLIKFKGGDMFKNFHFDVSSIPTKDDFTDWHTTDFGDVSVLCGFDWYCHEDKSQEPEELDCMIMAYFFAKGTNLGSEEEPVIVEQDSFGIIFGNGFPLYCDEGMAQVLKLMFGTDIPVGWVTELGSMKDSEYIDTYFQQEDAYGHLWEQGVEGSDYTKDWNGKFFGFKEEDYYEGGDDSSDDSSDEPGPEPPTPTELLPLYSGLQLHTGDNLVVDTTKGDEFATYLGTLAYSESRYTLMTSQYQGESFRLMRARQGDNPGEYFVIIGNKPIYATYTGSWNGWMDGVEYDVSFTEGFNNVADGLYSVDISVFSRDYQDISAINDTDPASWNGIVIGTH